MEPFNYILRFSPRRGGKTQMTEFLRKFRVQDMASMQENDVRMVVMLVLEMRKDDLMQEATVRPCHVSTTIMDNPDLSPIEILKKLEPWLQVQMGG